MFQEERKVVKVVFVVVVVVPFFFGGFGLRIAQEVCKKKVLISEKRKSTDCESKERRKR